jgi:hypothetical protein
MNRLLIMCCLAAAVQGSQQESNICTFDCFSISATQKNERSGQSFIQHSLEQAARRIGLIEDGITAEPVDLHHSGDQQRRKTTSSYLDVLAARGGGFGSLSTKSRTSTNNDIKVLDTSADSEASKDIPYSLGWIRRSLTKQAMQTEPSMEDTSDIVSLQPPVLYDFASFRSYRDIPEHSNNIFGMFSARGGGGTRRRLSPRGGSSLSDDDEDELSSIRGKGANKHPYAVSSKLVHGDGEALFESGCDLVGKKETVQFVALWDDNSPVLWKTFAFLSDTLVIALTEKTTVSPALIQGLQAGLVARKKQQLPKPRLMFVLHTDDKDELKEWRENFVLNELSGVSEQLVDSLQIVSSENFSRQKPKSRKGGVSKLVDTETFPVLLEQVHQAFGGPGDLLLENVLEREQEVEEDDDVEVLEPRKAGPSSFAVKDIYVNRASSFLETAFEQIEELQERLDNAVLKASSGAMPFDFSKYASPVLERIAKNMKSLPKAEQVIVRQQVGVRVQQLYQEQLASLRDYYGRLFESILGRGDSTKAHKHAVDKVLDQFRKAATAAVPVKISAFGSLDLEYLRTVATAGLKADLQQLIELQEEAVELDSDTEGKMRKQSIPTWYKKLASRGLVLGINYFQAWLAWQGIKRAALQRERVLPKFPLF